MFAVTVRHRLTTVTVTVLVAAAAAAAPAVAQHPLYPRGDDARDHHQDLRMPDRRSPAPALSQAGPERSIHRDLRSADARDDRRVYVSVPPAVTVDSGFDLSDAALGAGAFVLLLSVPTGAVALRRRRNVGKRAGAPVTAR